MHKERKNQYDETKHYESDLQSVSDNILWLESMPSFYE